jgi:hypothetical protein
MTQDQRNGFVKLVAELRSAVENRKYNYSDRSEYEDGLTERIAKQSDLASAQDAVEKARQALHRAEEAKERVDDKVREQVRKLMREWDDKKRHELNVFTLATSDILALDNADKASELIHRLSNL